MFFESMHRVWQSLLADQRELLESIESKLQTITDAGGAIAPPLPLVMRAFETDPNEIRVLLVGQDPYPTPGHAIGLSFATGMASRPLPRSLQNILKELSSDIVDVVALGDLQLWQGRGVLLLNRHLTTTIGQAGAHSALGWSAFTDVAIARLVELRSGKLVALLWGNQAQTLAPMLGGARVLPAVHPSPLSASRGFFGSKPFSKANAALSELGLEPIDWSC